MTERKMPLGHLQELIRTGHPDRPDECWLWPGAKGSGGYGLIRFSGRLQYAHRVAYELHVGPIPDGLMIDHICHARDCFNPAHLEPVTNGQNMQNRAELNANNTSGHRNVYWDKQRGMWTVRVELDGIRHHGGDFHSIEDATAAAELLREALCVRITTQEDLDMLAFQERVRRREVELQDLMDAQEDQ